MVVRHYTSGLSKKAAMAVKKAAKNSPAKQARDAAEYVDKGSESFRDGKVNEAEYDLYDAEKASKRGVKASKTNYARKLNEDAEYTEDYAKVAIDDYSRDEISSSGTKQAIAQAKKISNLAFKASLKENLGGVGVGVPIPKNHLDSRKYVKSGSPRKARSPAKKDWVPSDWHDYLERFRERYPQYTGKHVMIEAGKMWRSGK